MVRKFGKTHSCFAFDPFLHTFLCHHIIDSDMFAHIPDKIQKMHFPEPVEIINQFRSIGFGWIEVKKFGSSCDFYPREVLVEV